MEIEAAETVPSHTGHAVRGFVARVHRLRAGDAGAQPGAPWQRAAVGAQHVAPGADAWRDVASAPAETHVFAGHRDLISFLRDEFAKDCRA